MSRSTGEQQANNSRRLEAAALCERLARLHTDLGAKGYAEGMAERLHARKGEQVSAQYVEGLRVAVARLEQPGGTEHSYVYGWPEGSSVLLGGVAYKVVRSTGRADQASVLLEPLRGGQAIEVDGGSVVRHVPAEWPEVDAEDAERERAYELASAEVVVLLQYDEAARLCEVLGLPLAGVALGGPVPHDSGAVLQRLKAAVTAAVASAEGEA